MPPPPTQRKLCSAESERIGKDFIKNWNYYVSLLEDNQAEKDILKLLDLLEDTRKKWEESVAESLMYKEGVAAKENIIKSLQQENSKLSDLLRNCQSQVSHLTGAKNNIERELGEYKHLWSKLRNIIKTNDPNLFSEDLLAVINAGTRHISQSDVGNSTSSGAGGIQFVSDEDGKKPEVSSMDSDIDYDRTSDSFASALEQAPLQRASRKRRSRTQVPNRSVAAFDRHSAIKEEPEMSSIPNKRPRNVPADDSTSTPQRPSGVATIRGSMNRSRSECTLEKLKEELELKPKSWMLQYGSGRSTYDVRSPHDFPTSWTRENEEIKKRAHHVVKFFSSFESCDVCKKRFGFNAENAFKCVDCGIRFHRQCQDCAPMPCIPKVVISKNQLKKKCKLVDHCPKSHPQVPPVLIHCVIALERDRLIKEGIYRLPCSDAAVIKLYHEFLTSRVTPNLANVETETITGCIKKFLKDLRDSVIPSTSYEDFLKAVEVNNEQQIITCILDLPAPNRDTLAYFILHLQKVAENSIHNKMPAENLARVLAPLVVGYSKLATPCVENVNELSRNQYMIVLRLLKMSPEFWYRFIQYNMGKVMATEARTPGSKAALLTYGTPSKPPSVLSRLVVNNNRVDFQDHSTPKSQNLYPLVQPLNMEQQTTTMRGIHFKPAAI